MPPILKDFNDEWQPVRVVRVDLLFYCILSLLLHCFFFFLAPDYLFVSSDPLRSHKELIVEYTPAPPEPETPPTATLPPPQQQNRPEFVETNPNAPEREPKNSNQEAARNQQAAQEKIDIPDNSEKPKVEGTFDHSHKIVSGTITETSVPQPTPGVMTTTVPKQTQTTPPSDKPPADKDEKQSAPPPPPPDRVLHNPNFTEGIPMTTETTGNNTVIEKNYKPSPQKITRTGQEVEVKEESVKKEVIAEAAARGVPVPQARPKLHFQTPSGPLMKQPRNANSIGTIAVNAKFSEFGEYQQRMVEAISQQWHMLAQTSNLADGNLNTKVTLSFHMDSSGQIHTLTVLSTTATHTATLICQDAVLSRSPFGEWTDAMKKTLGDGMNIVFTFYYY